MGYILHIDTAAAIASVSIGLNGNCIALIENENKKDHASFLQPAIKKLLEKADVHIKQLHAVSVAAGPGSYTGLRVGFAAAKGLSYTLNIPFITISSLLLMAKAAVEVSENNFDLLFCPIIDARRMEVFTAVYNSTLKEILPAGALIVDNDSFADILLNNKVLFFGNAVEKFKAVCTHPNALFSGGYNTNSAMVTMAFAKYQSHLFTDLAYSEPLYGKEFYMGK